MKYNNVKLKENLTADEYQDLVAAIYNIQIYEDGVDFAYQPELLSMMLPSILAHTCLDGIEWDESETIMYSNEISDKIMADSTLSAIVAPIIESVEYDDITLPYYITRAMRDAEKKVAFKLDCNHPSDQLANAFVKILDDLGQIGEIIKSDDGKALVEALNRIASNG